MPQYVYDSAWAALGLATLVAGLCTVTGFFGRKWWICELFSHFRVQYFLFLSSSGIIYLLAGNPPVGTAAGVLAFINLGLILPLYGRRTGIQHTSQIYRAVSANVLQRNRSYHQVCRLIEKVNPDFVALLEVNEVWLMALRACVERYPYSIWQTRDDQYGIAFYSRLPMHWAEIVYFESEERPSVVAELEAEGKALTVVATHAPPPLSRAEAEERNSHLAKIAHFARERGAANLVLGDLNITSWSPHFQDFLEQSGLRDSREGFGLQPTWPTNMPVFLIPIDHVLHSEDIQIHKRRLGRYNGSDHLPVIVDFSLEEG